MPLRPSTRGVAVGGLVAVLYGLAMYMLGATSFTASIFSLVTVGFMAFVPFAIGYLTVFRMHEPSLATRIFAPWVVFAVVISICYLVGWEGTVCIVMALPWLLPFASLGGWFVGFIRDVKRARAATILAMAPLIIIPIERQIPAGSAMHTAVRSVVIAAPARDVWERVISVDTIRAAERRRALYTTIGFPAPIAATLDHPRVGGVRRASFDGNVVFTETITDWLDAERLRFTIKPNTAEIPRTTLDPHVTVGGEFFDVLTGTYELEPLGDTATRLTLTSEYAVATHFNRYSGWWADRIMESVQGEILRILKARAEQPQTAPALTADMRELESMLIGRAAAAARQGGGLVDEAAILTGARAVESVGGVSIPGFATPESVDESLRNVLAANASRARATGWMTSFTGMTGSGDAAVLRFEFEDRSGRCVAISRTSRVVSGNHLDLGARELSRCEVHALADVIKRGRRLAEFPFHAKGLDVIFTTVGDYPGTVDVYIDSVVVTVRGALMKTKLLAGRAQTVDSITASLAYHSGSSWGPGPPSNGVPLAWVAHEGDTRTASRFRFTIPRDSADSLSDRWIVFTHHLTVPKTPTNPYGTAWTYTHLSDSMFKGVPGIR